MKRYHITLESHAHPNHTVLMDAAALNNYMDAVHRVQELMGNHACPEFFRVETVEVPEHTEYLDSLEPEALLERRA